MRAITVKLHWKQKDYISEILKYEEARVIRRANILSCLDNGLKTELIAIILHVDPKTVTNVANEYLEKGLDAALFNDKQSGRPIDIDDTERSRIIAMVCTNPPSGHKRWTLDLIAEETISRGLIDNKRISREEIRIILQEHDLKPWQEKMWCIQELSEEYIDRMENILDLYELPSDPKNPVICVDEKPVQLLDEVREAIPMEPGAVKKVDYEYKRNGNINVFVGVEPLVGKYYLEVTDRKTGSDFAKYIEMIASNYPSAEKIHLVLDNYATHREKHLIDHFGEELGKKIWGRFEIHYTPKHASWLNQAEIAIGMYSRQCLAERMKSVENLKFQTNAWMNISNKKATKINWRFNKTKARKSLNYTNDREKLI